DVIVRKLEPDPKTLSAGAGSESFARRRASIGKVAHKIHTLDFRQRNLNKLARGVEQFQFAVHDKICRGDVPAERVAPLVSYNHFLMCGRHGPELILARFEHRSRLVTSKVAKRLTFMILFPVYRCLCGRRLSLV